MALSITDPMFAIDFSNSKDFFELVSQINDMYTRTKNQLMLDIQQQEDHSDLKKG